TKLFRSTIRIVEPQVTSADMEQQRRRNRGVVIQARGDAVDSLHADGADGEWQDIGARNLVGGLFGVIEREFVLLVDAVVDLDTRQVLVPVVGIVRNPVIDQARSGNVGCGNKLLNRQRDRIHAVFGNDVAGERLPVDQVI